MSDSFHGRNTVLLQTHFILEKTEEMMEKSGAGTRGSVHGHLSHLRAKAPDGHGLPVRYDRDSESYYFDFDQ